MSNKKKEKREPTAVLAVNPNEKRDLVSFSAAACLPNRQFHDLTGGHEHTHTHNNLTHNNNK